MPARFRMPLLMAAMAAMIAAGCGGGDEDSLDKAAFVKQAQAACAAKKGNLIAKVGAYVERNGRPQESAAELRAGAFEAVQLPIIEAELAAVGELGAPEEGAAGLEAFLKAEQRAIDAAAAADDERSRAEMKRRFDAAAELASDYGIPRCANPRSGLIGA
jgi:hypothetical protein